MGRAVRRRLLQAASLLLVLGMASACMTSEQYDGFTALNADRSANAMPVLGYDQMLENKAQAWAENLAAKGYLYHSNLPDGITGCWRWLGENVGYGPSISVIENAYMNSPGHRANILSPNYTVAAVGVAHHGLLVYTVQEFMQPC